MKLADATERTMAILASGTMASGEIAGGNFAERLSIAKRAEITKPFLKLVRGHSLSVQKYGTRSWS